MKKTKVLVLFAAVTAMALATNGEVVPTVLPPEVQKTPWLHIDASNASTLETEVNPDTGVVSVKSAKDASGGLRFVTSNGNPILGEFNGKSYFDFGALEYSSAGAGMRWSETCTTLREVFLVVCDNKGFFIGRQDGYEFHRGENGVLFDQSYASPLVCGGKIQIDGFAATASSVLTHGFHLLHIQTTGNVSADTFSIDRTSRFGGASLAEAIVFDQVLTDEEANALTGYLNAKWFKMSGDMSNQLLVELSIDLPVPDGVDLGCGKYEGLNAGESLQVTTLNAWTNETERFTVTCEGWKLYDEEGVFLKGGYGTVVEYVHPMPAAARRLVWQVVPRHIEVAPPPVFGSAFHVDASYAKSLTTDDEGRVLRWIDASFGENLAICTSTGNLPAMGESFGMPFVDFGAFTYNASAGRYLSWQIYDAKIREVYWVVSDYPGGSNGGFLLGDNDPNSAPTHFHRGDGKTLFATWAAAEVRNGIIQVDGKTVGWEYALPEGFHVIRVQTTGPVQASSFARDRNSRFGGVRLAEVLVYDRVLNGEESDATTAYLMSKWSQLGSWDNAILADEEAVALYGGGVAAKTIYVSRDGVYKLKFTCSGEDEESGQTIAFSVDDGASKTVEVRGVDIKKVSNAFELKAGVHKFHLKNASPNPDRKVNFGGFELRGVKAGLAISLG